MVVAFKSSLIRTSVLWYLSLALICSPANID